jgi:unsaturated rhamnogalacturonyl hydrolase
MATSKFGKGTVFAVGDPWIYNEYVVNDRLNATYQNKQAAIELTNWLLKQIPR